MASHAVADDEHTAHNSRPAARPWKCVHQHRARWAGIARQQHARPMPPCHHSIRRNSAL